MKSFWVYTHRCRGFSWWYVRQMVFQLEANPFWTGWASPLWRVSSFHLLQFPLFPVNTFSSVNQDRRSLYFFHFNECGSPSRNEESAVSCAASPFVLNLGPQSFCRGICRKRKIVWPKQELRNMLNAPWDNIGRVVNALCPVVILAWKCVRFIFMEYPH